MSRVRADMLLVSRGLAESRAKARAAIEAGRVTAGGRAVARASDLIDEDAELSAEPAHPWVGRGALKLAHAVDLWGLSLDGARVLDLGASTGGFTEVCLSHGARRVYAVDVGRDQLHPRLRADPRVVMLEGVDARTLTPELVPDVIDAVVCDASFISLGKVLPAALALARPGALLVALVKPQFELTPDAVGKGGLVKDPALWQAACDHVADFLAGSGWTVLGQARSPVEGGAGQTEFLIHAVRGA